MSARSWLRTSPLPDTIHHGEIVDTSFHRMTRVMPSPLDTIKITKQQQNLLSANMRPFERSLQLPLPAEPQEPLNPELLTTAANVTNDDEGFFFDLYESPCLLKASNDAFDYQDYQEFGLMCNATFFGGCNYDNMTALQQDLKSDSVVEWTIVFDYEIYYTGDPIPAVEQVENIILEHLSEITGLNGCSGEKHNAGADSTTQTGSVTSSRVTNDRQAEALIDKGYRRRKTTEYTHDFTEEELSRMMAISSDPTDLLDPDHSKCFEEISC